MNTTVLRRQLRRFVRRALSKSCSRWLAAACFERIVHELRLLLRTIRGKLLVI
jgi:hypothetical protein